MLNGVTDLRRRNTLSRRLASPVTSWTIYKYIYNETQYKKISAEDTQSRYILTMTYVPFVALLGRVALGAQRPIVVKLYGERSVVRSVCLSSASVSYTHLTPADE